MLDLLLSEGPKARSEVVRMFTRTNMPDRQRGNTSYVTSKAELITRAVFKSVEKNFGVKERIQHMRVGFQDIFLPLVVDILEEELALLQVTDVRMSDKMNPAFIRAFDFQSYQKRCEEKSPTAWKLIRGLCGPEGRESESVSGQLQKDRDLCCSIVMGSILHARSVRANVMPTMMGLAMHALHVPKRAVALFGRVGISVSYSTILRILKKNAEEIMEEVKQRVRGGEAFGIVYDNLVFMKRVGAESMLNRANLEKMTVSAMYFLRMPARIPRPGVCLRESLYDTLPGLHRRSCLLEMPRQVTVLDILGLGDIAEYWAKESDSQILGVLKECFPNEVQRNRGIGSMGKAVYRKIQVHQSSFWVLPTLDIDPGSLSGNIDVMMEIGSMLGLQSSDMVDRMVMWNGDLFTTAMQNSAKQMRSRDLPEHRLQHVEPWPAYLHAQFAMVSGISALHMGDSKAWEPFSLMLFVTLLGRTKLVGPKPSYHALHNFIKCIRNACVLAGAMVELGCTTMSGLRKKLEDCDLDELVRKLATKLMDLNAVGEERASASDAAWRGFLEEQCPLARSLSKKEKRMKKAEFVHQAGDPSRDLVFENMRLFVNHASIYLAFYEHCRWGDTGGLEKNLNLQMMFFYGAKKPR